MDYSTVQCPKQGAADMGTAGCSGHSSTQLTDGPQMCALCRQAALSFTPVQRDEGLQLREATGEAGLLYVTHAAALGLPVCPLGGLGFWREPGPVLLAVVPWWLPVAGTCSSRSAAA